MARAYTLLPPALLVGLCLTSCAHRRSPTGPEGAFAEIEWSQPILVFRPTSGGAWYPRLLELDDGTLLCAYDTNEGSPHTQVRVSVSHDGGQNWGVGATVFAANGCDCANPHLIQRADGSVLCAFREVGCYPFRIRLAISRDRGQTWSSLSVVDSSVHGLWEPFLLSAGHDTLHVFYSSEAHQPDFPQVVAMRTSTDGGRSWGPERVVASAPQSRDGMASVVVTPDGQWLCFFEATDEANPFVVKLVRSRDGGKTWGERALVYKPADASREANAPFGILLRDGSLLVTFQTNEDRPIEESVFAPDLKYVQSFDAGQTWSEPRPILSGDRGYWWNSVLQLRDGTLLAASSVAARGKMEIVVVRGKMKG